MSAWNYMDVQYSISMKASIRNDLHRSFHTLQCTISKAVIKQNGLKTVCWGNIFQKVQQSVQLHGKINTKNAIILQSTSESCPHLQMLSY